MLPQMSVTEDLPDMDGADLLGLLFHDGQDGCAEPLFPDGNGLIESWLSEQDVRLMFRMHVFNCQYTTNAYFQFLKWVFYNFFIWLLPLIAVTK